MQDVHSSLMDTKWGSVLHNDAMSCSCFVALVCYMHSSVQPNYKISAIKHCASKLIFNSSVT